MSTAYDEGLRLPGGHRVGVRIAEASVASRSDANPNAMRTRWRSVSWVPAGGAQLPASRPPRISGRAHPAGIGIPKFANQLTHKINRASCSAHHLEAHRIAHEGFAHKTLPPTPFDLAVAPHPPHPPPARVADDRPPYSPALPTIDLRGRPLLQRFVR